MLQLSLVQGWTTKFSAHIFSTSAFQKSKGGLHFAFSSPHQVWAGLPLCIHPPPHPPARHRSLARLALRQADALLPHHRTGGAEERASTCGDWGAEGEKVGERACWQGACEVESLTQGGGGSKAWWWSAPFDAQPRALAFWKVTWQWECKAKSLTERRGDAQCPSWCSAQSISFVFPRWRVINEKGEIRVMSLI